MKNLASLTALYSILVFTACSADAAKTTAAPVPTTDEQKTLYALGQTISKSLEPFELKPDELALVQKGMADGATGAKTDIKYEDYQQKIQELVQNRIKATGERNVKEGTDYIAKAEKEAGATKTASGIVIKQTKEGTGASPKAEDNVKVHYEGRLINGKVFDSSMKRGEPATFPLNGVIACWTEGVQTMKVGGKAQFTCPSSLAYGERGSPPNIMPNSTLIFDVELLEIVKPEAPPAPAPEVKPEPKK
jgi:FKBP-type peptidyl-prolyl cis-trans isomerase FkpA